MDETRRCIFHIPYEPDPAGRPSGTNIRPGKMLQGFKDAGFEVFEIVGDSRTRKKAIAEAKHMIQAGELFEFVYSESETNPTMLTDSDHFPRHPFMDFSFMRFCRTRNIPVGLFYRDAYWQSGEFEGFREGILERAVTQLHKFDLMQYRTAVDVMFVPSKSFGELIEEYVPGIAKVPLPSGCEGGGKRQIDRLERSTDEPLRLIYVGGISQGGAYDLSCLVSSVAQEDKVSLDLCVRDQEWESVRDHYEPMMASNTRLHHVSGASLRDLYRYSDIGALVCKPSRYRDLCMPVKLFEYLGEGLPILTLQGTAAGDFVEQNGVGWTVDAVQEEISSTLEYLCKHLDEVRRVRSRCIEVAKTNTWRARAIQAAQALCKTKVAGF